MDENAKSFKYKNVINFRRFSDFQSDTLSHFSDDVDESEQGIRKKGGEMVTFHFHNWNGLFGHLS